MTVEGCWLSVEGSPQDAAGARKLCFYIGGDCRLFAAQD